MNGPACEWADCVPKAISAIVGASWVHVDKPCSTFVRPVNLGLSIALTSVRCCVQFLFSLCIVFKTPRHVSVSFNSFEYSFVWTSICLYYLPGGQGGRWLSKVLCDFIIPVDMNVYLIMFLTDLLYFVALIGWVTNRKLSYIMPRNKIIIMKCMKNLFPIWMLTQ